MEKISGRISRNEFKAAFDNVRKQEETLKKKEKELNKITQQHKLDRRNPGKTPAGD